MYWCLATAFNASTPESDVNFFFHDNRATKSIFNDCALFQSYNSEGQWFQLWSLAPASAGGVVHLESIINGCTITIILDISDALHVPRIPLCMSISYWVQPWIKKGVTAVTQNGKIELSKNGQVIAQGSLWKGL